MSLNGEHPSLDNTPGTRDGDLPSQNDLTVAGVDGVSKGVPTVQENGEVKAILPKEHPLPTTTADNKNETSEYLRKSNRTIKYTQKGRENALNNLITIMKSCQKRLHKQTEIVTLLLDGSNRDMVDNEMNTLEKTYSEFADSYARACELIGEDEKNELEEFQTTTSNLMEAADSTYLDCK